MPVQTQTRRIVISVDSNGAAGLKDIADKLGGVNKNTKDLADGMRALGAATTAFLGIFSIRELLGFSDEIQVLNNRLVALTGSQEAAKQTLTALTDVARATNQSLTSTAETYLTIANATKAANLSSGTLIELTQTLTNTFRLSGASAEEAAAATKSLALGFQLGGIQGRELRTVMRQNTVLAGLLRKEFGSTLKSDAQLGFLTVGKLMEILHRNADQVNTTATKLTATFGQSLTKGLDAVKLGIFDLTSAMGGPAGLSTAMGFLIDHMGQVIAVGTILALTTLPKIISAIRELAVTLLTVNPYVAVAGLEAMALFFTSGAKDIKEFFLLLKLGFIDIEARIDRAVAKFYELDASLPRPQSSRDKLLALAAASRNAATDAEVHARALILEANAQAELDKQSGKSIKNFAADVASANKNLKFDDTARIQLARLNREYETGHITLSQYNETILKLDVKKATREFHDGAINVSQFHDQLRAIELVEINRQFKNGALSINEFNEAIHKVQLDKLNEDLETGKISLADYNSKLASVSDKFSASGAFRTGLQDYLSSIGTTTQQVAGLIKTAFSDLETVFVDFVKTGTFNFNKFTQTVLDDLTRIIIRATIIQPLATGVLSAFTPTAVATPTSNIPTGGYNGQPVASAYGNVFDHGLQKFATGAVVSSPTLFGYGNNKTGLMGEAGPEAILPLKRGSGGALGVAAAVTPVHINIINNNGSQVEQHETTGPNGEKTIEVLINNKVRDGIASGRYDKAFKQAYGLGRKGQ